MTAIENKAKRTNIRTRLQPADLAAFFSAMDNPPQPTERLKDAADRFKATLFRP